uniref:Phosphoglycerate kinase n=1 Tax=Paramecium tetraurelia TaxID=5888 RepID=Q3SE99_PARTE|nr:phosphoglycerate kinase, putative [Paramecium tetraurelia]
MLSSKAGIDHVLRQFTNKRVLIRVDFNVPIKEGKVKNATRIQGAIPTLKKILEQNPKNVTLMSHMGRPDGKRVEKDSLKIVVPKLEELLGTKINFVNDCVGSEAVEASNAGNGQINLLENLRFHIQEEGKGLDANGAKIKADKESVKKFRKELSSLGDIYVNDAFGTAHRAHSSMVGIDHKVRVAGYLMKKELDYFARALETPQRPFLVILGGAKVADKIQLIKSMLDKVDEMIIGGGMAFTFLKKIHNVPIGKTLFDEEGYKIVDEILAKAKERNVKIHLPTDFVCGTGLDASSPVALHDLKSGIPDGWLGLDAGQLTQRENAEAIGRAKTIVWNGPQGAFEIEQFKNGSVSMLNALVKQTQSGATTIVGGGDTVNLVGANKANDKLSHVSTGGGASLELLEGKILPGVEYLTNIKDL